MTYQVEPIAVISSPYKEKFSIPRQPNLAPDVISEIKLVGEYNNSHMVKGLSEFSHLWLQFVFHQTIEQGWKPLVRPPRLGGNAKQGVLATRSPFRPNFLGLSVVKLVDVKQESNQTTLVVSGADLVDQTPVVDIKPYIPYADCVENAFGSFAQSSPSVIPVRFLSEASENLDKNEVAVITQVLQQDPRPAYKQDKLDMKEYGVKLFDYNVKFKYDEGQLVVTTIEKSG